MGGAIFIMEGGTVNLLGTVSFDQTIAIDTSTGAISLNAVSTNNMALGGMRGSGTSDPLAMSYGDDIFMMARASLVINTDNDLVIPSAIEGNRGIGNSGDATGGGLTKQGSMRLTLVGDNSFSGITTVSDGELRIGNSNNNDRSGKSLEAAVVVNGSNAILSGSFTIESLASTDADSAIDSSGTLTITEGIVSPGINGSGDIAVTGAITHEAGGTILADLGTTTAHITTSTSISSSGSLILILPQLLDNSNNPISYTSGNRAIVTVSSTATTPVAYTPDRSSNVIVVGGVTSTDDDGNRFNAFDAVTEASQLRYANLSVDARGNDLTLVVGDFAVLDAANLTLPANPIVSDVLIASGSTLSADVTTMPSTVLGATIANSVRLPLSAGSLIVQGSVAPAANSTLNINLSGNLEIASSGSVTSNRGSVFNIGNDLSVASNATLNVGLSSTIAVSDAVTLNGTYSAQIGAQGESSLIRSANESVAIATTTGMLIVNFDGSTNYLAGSNYDIIESVNIIPDFGSGNISDTNITDVSYRSSATTLSTAMHVYRIAIDTNVIQDSNAPLSLSELAGDTFIRNNSSLTVPTSSTTVALTIRNSGTLSVGTITSLSSFTHEAGGTLNVSVEAIPQVPENPAISTTTSSITATSMLNFNIIDSFANYRSRSFAFFSTNSPHSTAPNNISYDAITPSFRRNGMTYSNDFIDFSIARPSGATGSTTLSLNSINIALGGETAHLFTGTASSNMLAAAFLIDGGQVEGSFEVNGKTTPAVNADLTLRNSGINSARLIVGTMSATISATQPSVHVMRNFSQTDGEIEFKIDGSGMFDQLRVDGSATITGNALLRVVTIGDVSSYSTPISYQLFDIRGGTQASMPMLFEAGSDFNSVSFYSYDTATMNYALLTTSPLFAFSDSGELTLSSASAIISSANILQQNLAERLGESSSLVGYNVAATGFTISSTDLTASIRDTRGNDIQINNPIWFPLNATATFSGSTLRTNITGTADSNGMLPQISQNNFRGFFIRSGNATFSNLIIDNARTQGGSAQRGGAAAGLGGAFYVDQGAMLTLSNVTISNCEAVGGDTSASNSSFGGASINVAASNPATGSDYGGAGFGGFSLDVAAGGAGKNASVDPNDSTMFLSGTDFGVGASGGTASAIDGMAGGGGYGVQSTTTPASATTAGMGGIYAGGGGIAIGASTAVDLTAGSGGFGAGGGAVVTTGRTAGTITAGDGGFGAGGGVAYAGGATTSVVSGTSGFGASDPIVVGANYSGGCGGGFGGAIFAREGSSVTLAGDISFSNNMAIGGMNALITDSTMQGQGLGDDIFLMSSATLVVNTASDLRLTSAIESNRGLGSTSFSGGGLTKAGSARLTLTQDNSYSGTTTVNGGELRIDNTIETDTVIDGSSAILSGNFTIEAIAVGTTSALASNGDLTLTNGILSPGINGEGSVTIEGDLTQSANGAIIAAIGATVADSSNRRARITADNVALDGVLVLVLPTSSGGTAIDYLSLLTTTVGSSTVRTTNSANIPIISATAAPTLGAQRSVVVVGGLVDSSDTPMRFAYRVPQAFTMVADSTNLRYAELSTALSGNDLVFNATNVAILNATNTLPTGTIMSDVLIASGSTLTANLTTSASTLLGVDGNADSSTILGFVPEPFSPGSLVVDGSVEPTSSTTITLSGDLDIRSIGSVSPAIGSRVMANNIILAGTYVVNITPAGSSLLTANNRVTIGTSSMLTLNFTPVLNYFSGTTYTILSGTSFSPDPTDPNSPSPPFGSVTLQGGAFTADLTYDLTNSNLTLESTIIQDPNSPVTLPNNSTGNLVIRDGGILFVDQVPGIADFIQRAGQLNITLDSTSSNSSYIMLSGSATIESNAKLNFIIADEFADYSTAVHNYLQGATGTYTDAQITFFRGNTAVDKMFIDYSLSAGAVTLNSINIVPDGVTRDIRGSINASLLIDGGAVIPATPNTDTMITVGTSSMPNDLLVRDADNNNSAVNLYVQGIKNDGDEPNILVNGDFTQSGAARIRFDVDSNNMGSQIAVTGDATILDSSVISINIIVGSGSSVSDFASRARSIQLFDLRRTGGMFSSNFVAPSIELPSGLGSATALLTSSGEFIFQPLGLSSSEDLTLQRSLATLLSSTDPNVDNNIVIRTSFTIGNNLFLVSGINGIITFISNNILLPINSNTAFGPNTNQNVTNIVPSVVSTESIPRINFDAKRGFFIRSGEATVSGIEIANAIAKGGNAAVGGAGGGLGGAFFVAENAMLTLDNVVIRNCQACGGSTSSAVSSFGGASVNLSADNPNNLDSMGDNIIEYGGAGFGGYAYSVFGGGAGKDATSTAGGDDFGTLGSGGGATVDDGMGGTTTLVNGLAGGGGLGINALTAGVSNSAGSGGLFAGGGGINVATATTEDLIAGSGGNYGGGGGGVVLDDASAYTASITPGDGGFGAGAGVGIGLNGSSSDALSGMPGFGGTAGVMFGGDYIGGAGAGFGGAIFLAANSSLTITGTITFDNNMAVGGISGLNSALAAGQDIFMRSSSAITFDLIRDTATTIDLSFGPIEGDRAAGITTGGITKDGAAIIELVGANTYSGTTTINDGVLVVNGSLTSNVAVAGGTFSGSFSVLANISSTNTTTTAGDLMLSSGSLIPGTMGEGQGMIAGNFMHSGGTLVVDVTPTNSDMVVPTMLGIVAGGTTTIDSNAMLIFEIGDATYFRGTRYTIIDSGAFSSTDTYGSLRPNFDTRGVFGADGRVGFDVAIVDNMRLVYTVQRTVLASIYDDIPQNIRNNIENSIDSGVDPNTTDGRNQLLNELLESEGSTSTILRDNDANITSNVQTNSAQFGAINVRVSQRSGGGHGGSHGFHDSHTTAIESESESKAHNWQLWSTAIGNFVDNSIQQSFTQSGSLILGCDYLVSHHNHFGLAYGYTRTEVNGDLLKSATDIYALIGYTGFSLGEFHINFLSLFAGSFNSLVRQVGNIFANSSSVGTLFAAKIGTQYSHYVFNKSYSNFKLHLLEPFANAEIHYGNRAAFQEVGAQFSNLFVLEGESYVMRAEAGLRSSFMKHSNAFHIKPLLNLSYVIDYGLKIPVQRFRTENRSGDETATLAPIPTVHYATCELGIECFNTIRNDGFRLSYKGFFNRNIHAHQVSLLWNWRI